MTPPTRKSSRTGAGSGRLRQPAPSSPARKPADAVAPPDESRNPRSCALCADEMAALGLPYRVVLRCTHGDR